ncbi:hypothetical protein A7U60_g2591 [Sanghuangporus baumii]|uniref:Uncharacterized protein n=1 Tax=Sanghuangporus baumii TaxID=108892 RepID=A0A9Q5I1Z8_SANBA|nr:hypothetical protein A7U60_g2591 [Sanghuangporus baumii]
MAPGLFYTLSTPELLFTDIPRNEVLLISKLGKPKGKYHVFGQYRFILSPEPLNPEDAKHIMKCCGMRMASDAFENDNEAAGEILSSVPEKDQEQLPALSQQIRVCGMQCIEYSDALLKFVLEKKRMAKAKPEYSRFIPAPPISTSSNSKKRGRHQQSASKLCDDSSSSDGADDETLEIPSHKQRRVGN